MGRRRNENLGEELGTEVCLIGNTVKSRKRWTGHMIRMAGERLPNLWLILRNNEVAGNEDVHG